MAVASGAAAVTPSDSTVLNADYLYIGVTGDVAVMPRDRSTAVTYKAFPAGQFLYLKVAKVMSTGTTATDIVAHFGP